VAHLDIIISRIRTPKYQELKRKNKKNRRERANVLLHKKGIKTKERKRSQLSNLVPEEGRGSGRRRRSWMS